MTKTFFFKAVSAIALLAVFALPLVMFLYVYPAFTGLITRNTQDDAIKITDQLAHMSIKPGEVNRESFNADFESMVRELQDHFGLVKVKVFASTGEVVYSTDSDDIGKFNEKPYFRTIVAKGKPYSKVVKEGKRTAEGQMAYVDVVETYVPVMRAGSFVGAFEIYMDVTEKRERIYNLISLSVFIVVAISIILLIGVAYTSLMVKKTVEQGEEAVKALQTSEKKFALAFGASPNWIAIARLSDGRYIEVNDAFLRTTGYTRGEVIGYTSTDLGIWEDPEQRELLVQRLREEGQVRNQEVNFRTKAGEPLVVLWSAERIELDGEECIIAINQDITERKQWEESLVDAQHTDYLTGLPNRRYFSEMLERAVSYANRHKSPLSLIMADIDLFKGINDKYGRDMGDVVLKEMGNTLNANCRLEDVVVRYGGEEFMKLLPNAKLEQAMVCAERARKTIESKSFEGIDRDITASFGVAEYMRGESMDVFLKRVDAALYEAKKAGRNCIRTA